MLVRSIHSPDDFITVQQWFSVGTDLLYVMFLYYVSAGIHADYKSVLLIITMYLTKVS